MKLPLGFVLILFALLALCTGQTAANDHEKTKIQTTYDSVKDKTTVRLLPVKISGPKAQYHSIHIAPAFSYPGKSFQKPQQIDFEVQTVVKTKLDVDLYVLFVVDGEEIFLSSNRSAVKNPVPGKKWIGERLVFRMPYDTLMKITKAKSVEIKMDGVRFPIEGTALEQVREFAARIEQHFGVCRIDDAIQFATLHSASASLPQTSRRLSVCAPASDGSQDKPPSWEFASKLSAYLHQAPAP